MFVCVGVCLLSQGHGKGTANCSFLTETAAIHVCKHNTLFSRRISGPSIQSGGFFCFVLFFVKTRGKRVVCTEQVLSRVCLFCKFPSSVALLSCLKMSPEENLVVEQADNHLKQHNNGIVCFSMCSSDV